MNPLVARMSAAVALNSRLLRNSLADVEEVAARRRPADGVNSMAFIAVHLVDARHYLVRHLGGDAGPSFGGRFDDATSIDDVGEMPSLVEILEAWDAVSSALEERTTRLSEAELLAASPSPAWPSGDQTVAGGFLFLLQHEAYHIGQLGLLRRLLGLGPLDYG